MDKVLCNIPRDGGWGQLISGDFPKSFLLAAFVAL